jgi:molecular chaperone IbpA
MRAARTHVAQCATTASLPFRVQASALNLSSISSMKPRSGSIRRGYPLYDIVGKDDSTYTIHLVVAGFSAGEINITAKQNLLTVSGQRKAEEKRRYLYEGTSARSFERQFSLADYVEVRGASYENGILEIELHQEIPEAAKPRKIAINGGASTKLIN